MHIKPQVVTAVSFVIIQKTWLVPTEWLPKLQGWRWGWDGKECCKTLRNFWREGLLKQIPHLQKQMICPIYNFNNFPKQGCGPGSNWRQQIFSLLSIHPFPSLFIALRGNLVLARVHSWKQKRMLLSFLTLSSQVYRLIGWFLPVSSINSWNVVFCPKGFLPP